VKTENEVRARSQADIHSLYMCADSNRLFHETFTTRLLNDLIRKLLLLASFDYTVFVVELCANSTKTLPSWKESFELVCTV